MEGAVITVSDRAAADVYEDRSGPLAVELLAGHGVTCGATIVPDDPQEIRRAIRKAIKAGARIVLTTGGTGISPSDLTPQVTAELLSVELPGIVDEIRRRGAAGGQPLSLLSRGVAGVVVLKSRPPAFVVNAPGSRGGVRDAVAVVGPLAAHIVDQLDGGDHPGGHLAP